MGIPKIRFKGYTEDWEQRKLNEYLNVSTAKNKDNHYGKEDVLSVSGDYGIVNQIEFQGRSFAGAFVANYGVVKTGDVVYTKSPLSTNPYGIIKANKGKSGIVSTLYAVYKPCKNVNSEFVQVYFELNSRMNNYMQPLVNKGAKNDMKVTAENALKGGVYFPKLKEQDAIVEYFRTLDHRITLHRRKCEETKKLKKYMLQKMFPQNGQSVPKIRFAGFTEDWEQRKATDLGEIYIGLVTTMTEHYTDKGHLLIRNSDIKDGYFEFGENPIYLDEEFSEQNKSRMHQLGDVITVHTGDIGTSAVIGENEVNSIGFATIVTRPNQDVLDSNYFATYLNTDTHKQWAVSMATGDGRSNYNLKDYTKLVVPVPQMEEQKKIAACVGALNNLIILHQRKCAELQNIKKYMLQNMFV